MTERDEERLAGVHPALVAAIREVFDAMAIHGTPMFIVKGVRTPIEQAALYQQGRTAPGPHVRAGHLMGDIVTYKDGYVHKSNHQPRADGYGHAVDCAFIATATRRDPFDQTWPWEAYGHELEQRGIGWGARFRGIGDLDHAELSGDAPVALTV